MIPEGLPALEARLAADLVRLDLPRKPWVVSHRHDGIDVLDVAVVGAGMAGLAVAAALELAGVPTTLFDQSPEGFEGPWATTARMETLRSPKTLAGPALGLPALTFRAWFEAQHGAAEWEALGLIPRLQWMDYLRWYRRVLALDVRNGHRVRRILPLGDSPVMLEIAAPAGAFTVRARRVIVATGRDGLGAAWMPDIARAIPPEQRAHSADPMDYGRLRGLRVAVVGGGASAMDVAATALEAGAASVDLLIRRPDLPRINKGKGAGNPGFVLGFYHLPDHWKWRIRHYIGWSQTPPPQGSTLRVSRHPNAHFNLGCTIERITVAEGGARADGGRRPVLQVETSTGRFDLDFVLFSTGFQIDWAQRPEFATFADRVLAWKHRFTPPTDQHDQEMLDSPYLGPGFEFIEKEPGTCPGLGRVHCFCYPATMSHGTVSGDIPAISEGAERLARAIISHLYHEDVEAQFAAIRAYADPELVGNEWRPARPPGLRHHDDNGNRGDAD